MRDEKWRKDKDDRISAFLGKSSIRCQAALNAIRSTVPEFTDINGEDKVSRIAQR